MSTGAQKLRLRRRLLSQAGAELQVLETHGGWGRVYEGAWWTCAGGVVFEIDPGKAAHLAHQRPTWDVYEGDSARALAGGWGERRAFDVVDLDPYGSSLEYLPALFAPTRARPPRWWLVANCGMRQFLRVSGGWRVKQLAPYVERFGSGQLYRAYLDLLPLVLADLAGPVGERVVSFEGYHCGDMDDMTHYLVEIERTKKSPDESSGLEAPGAARKRSRRADAGS